MSETPGKYSALIGKAKATSKPDSQKNKKQTDVEANLCVRVPKRYRQHWAGRAKLEGTTMTTVIVEALTEAFGLPE